LRGSGTIIEKLDRSHLVDSYNCGHEDLNRHIRRFAFANQAAGSAQTYVAAADGQVIGYYNLAVGAVAHALAPPRVAKGLARHPVPVMLLARRFYGHFDFDPSPTDAYHLFLLIKAILRRCFSPWQC